MSEFKASNGWRIDKAGNVCTPSGVVVITGGESEHVAKFFQELRDHELNRWRDPVNPDYVVYPRGAGIVDVLRESQLGGVPGIGVGVERGITRSEAEGREGDIARHFYDAACRYFDAHPEHKPLPEKDGLYVAASVRGVLESARVFKLHDGGWADAGRYEHDPKAVRALVQRVHDDEGLVRLTASDD